LWALCRCCFAQCLDGVLTNVSSVVKKAWVPAGCPPARSGIQQVCTGAVWHKSLSPCCFRFMTRTQRVSAMGRDAVPSWLKQMAQRELRKNKTVQTFSREHPPCNSRNNKK
jgi:hypothetical protein